MHQLPNSGVAEVKVGEKIRGVDSAGRGYGYPLTRDADAAPHDVRESWETRERAETIYKVFFTADLSRDDLAIDVAATRAARSVLA